MGMLCLSYSITLKPCYHLVDVDSFKLVMISEQEQRIVDWTNVRGAIDCGAVTSVLCSSLHQLTAPTAANFMVHRQRSADTDTKWLLSPYNIIVFT